MSALSQPAAVRLRARLLWPLILFTLAVTFATLIGEAFKTRLIGYMRFADFEELAINSLLYLIALVFMNEVFVEVRAPRILRMIFVGLVVTFMIGQGMRIAANSVNAFSTEIRDYRAIIPADMYALLYFFDENLAHLFIYLSRYGLFACILVLDASYLSRENPVQPQWLALGSGILYGLWEAIVFLEGQKLYLIPFVMVALSGVWVWQWQKSRQSLKSFWHSGPMIAFSVGLLVIPIGLLLWAAITGGFCEPSQYFLGRCK